VRVLSIDHGSDVRGGVFDDTVTAAGHELERWSVPESGTPDPARSYDAVLVFGGSMHPDEDAKFDWLAREEEYLREVLAEDVPVFAVCLGAQMLARAAGATVGPASAPEIGWCDIDLTAAGEADPVLGVLPRQSTVFQWHHYTFEIPAGGVELARSAICTQAFRLTQQAWGVQFHPEITLPMLTAWSSDDGAEELPMSADELRRRSEIHIDRSTENGTALATAFLREASPA
jgi:GMP synthase (glutamine-hydrolysing)